MKLTRFNCNKIIFWYHYSSYKYNFTSSSSSSTSCYQAEWIEYKYKWLIFCSCYYLTVEMRDWVSDVVVWYFFFHLAKGDNNDSECETNNTVSHREVIFHLIQAASVSTLETLNKRRNDWLWPVETLRRWCQNIHTDSDLMFTFHSFSLSPKKIMFLINFFVPKWRASFLSTFSVAVTFCAYFPSRHESNYKYFALSRACVYFLCSHVRHAMLKPVLVHHKHFCVLSKQWTTWRMLNLFCDVCEAIISFQFLLFNLTSFYWLKTSKQVALALPAFMNLSSNFISTSKFSFYSFLRYETYYGYWIKEILRVWHERFRLSLLMHKHSSRLKSKLSENRLGESSGKKKSTMMTSQSISSCFRE